MPLPVTVTMFLGAALFLAAGSEIGCMVLTGLGVLNELLVLFLTPKVLNEADDDR